LWLNNGFDSLESLPSWLTALWAGFPDQGPNVLSQAPAREVLKIDLNRSQFFSRAHMSLGMSTLVQFGDFELDLETRRLSQSGKPIALSPRTLDLLIYLVQNSQRVVTREELLNALWPDSFVDESNLSQHIFLLRKALNESRETAKLVRTLPGRGYEFVARVKPAGRASEVSPTETMAQGGFALHAEQSITRFVVEETEDDSETRTSQSQHWKGVVLGTAAIAAILGAGYLVREQLRPPALGHVRVVNTGLTNATGDPMLDDSLNEALRIDLEQSPFLDLLSRTQVQETLQQMQQPSDAVLTPALAREVCERNNNQAILHGTLTSFGSQYVLTFAADSCLSGKQVAGYKTEISRKEDLLRALDRAAASVRRQLGESSASREQYEMPIEQATTSSLEALRAYTQGGQVFRRGDMRAAQPLLERAVTLDPQFASAWRGLASTWYNLGDYAQAATLYTRAFELREHATERERLAIEMLYYGYALNDYEESVRRTQQSLQIYPDAANSWVNLANVYTLLGEYARAIDASQHALTIDPHSGVAAIELTRALMRDGRFSEARMEARKAMADGKDHWDLHSMLFQMAYAEHNVEETEREGHWPLTHQHVNQGMLDLARASAAEGRLAPAMDEFVQARSEALRTGEADFANGVTMQMALALTLLQQPAQAAALLRQARGNDGNPDTPGELALLQVSTGNTAAATAFLQTTSPDDRNTVRAYIFVPMVRAMLALKAHKSEEAVRALEPARPWQMRNYSIPYLRAQAEAEAGMLDAAAADYRLILDHPGVDSIAPEYSLAHLQLARVLAREKNADAARREYGAFLEAWAHADAKLPQTAAARREMATLKKREE
jgi:eukaryotic-like serine/threonine-protein kinase